MPEPMTSPIIIMVESNIPSWRVKPRAGTDSVSFMTDKDHRVKVRIGFKQRIILPSASMIEMHSGG
jgi:hypothetical protein